jgi:hypothetical protein
MDLRRALWAASLAVALFVLAAASVDPAAPRGGPPFAPAPDEGCIEATQAAGATPGPGQSETCQSARTGTGGSGGGLLVNLLPLVAVIGAGILGVALAVAVFVIRTQPRGVPEPVEGWWRCATCGANNLAEAPRCHKCGTWQPTSGARTGRRITP